MKDNNNRCRCRDEYAGYSPLYAAINLRLACFIRITRQTLPWYGAWMSLSSESTAEERLSVYQAIRDAGSLPEEAGFYLVAWQIDTMTGLNAEQTLQTLDWRMAAIEEAYGFELGLWPRGNAPEEYEDLTGQYDQAWDELHAENLAAFGELEMARLFREDQRRFNLLLEAGRQYFHGPWVRDTVWEDLSVGL